MSGTYTDQAGNIYASTYGKVRTYSPGATYTTYNPSTTPYQGVAYPTQPTTYSTFYPTQPQTYQMYDNPAATSNPTYGETLAGCKPVTGEALDVPGQKSSASKPGKVPFHSFHRRRGNMGGGGKWSNKKKIPRPFSCAKHHPVAALKHFYPEADFTAVCSYHVNQGSAHVYSVVIDDVVYQGEGTTSKIAKAIAAAKALEGIRALDYDKVEVVADYEKQKEEVVKRIQEWQHNHAAKTKAGKKRKKSKKEDAGGQTESSGTDGKTDQIDQHTPKKPKVKIEPGTEQPAVPIGPVLPAEKSIVDIKQESVAVNKQEPGIEKANNVPVSLLGQPAKDYGLLRSRYGPNIIEEFSENRDQGPQFFCTLTVQGFHFTGRHTSKKRARNEAVRLAFLAFEASPPPLVNVTVKSAKRVPKPRCPPVDFPDMLAEKCWNFASEHLARVQAPYKHLKNLVFVVKIEGKEDIENCEIVSFGHGTRLIKMENLKSDGTLIDDCSGDSLALRGFRRYLITQVEACVKAEPSVYQEDVNNRFKIREGVEFIFYTTNCPNGGCRNFTRDPRKPSTSNNANSDSNQESAKEMVEGDEMNEKDSSTPETEKREENRGGDGNTLDTGRETSEDSVQDKTALESQESNCEDKTAADKDNSGAGKISSPKKYHHGRGWSNRTKNYGSNITYAKKDDINGSKEYVGLYDEKTSHCIVSPSDKLAMRNVCGVQGSILSEVSSPVFIQHYLITLNKNNSHEMKKILYDRVKGTAVKYERAPPQIRGVRWRPTDFLPKSTLFACIWAKGFDLENIYSCEGKQFDGTVENLDWSQSLDQSILTQSSYCTLQLFTEFRSVCARSGFPCADKYSDIKLKIDGEHQAAKAAVKKHLEEAGMGTWIEREVPTF